MNDLADKDLLKTSSYIGGRWVKSTSLGFFKVKNPYSGAEIASVDDLDAQDIEKAVDAAYSSFQSWKLLTAEERSDYLMSWHALMMERQEDLARLMTLEQGKPLKESRGEIAYAAGFVKWFAQEARRSYGDIIPSHKREARIIVFQEPVGVCAVLTPWNFPSAMITRKAAAALAAGCPVIVKPASSTPLSALALAELADRAGFPDGVFNVITTSNSARAGKILSSQERIRKLSFTGSTEVGRILMEQSAGTLKKLSLELGGNAPFIVFEDADLKKAVDGLMACKFRNAGQTCICANRIFVHRKIHQPFLKDLLSRVRDLKHGDGLDEATDIGPLISANAVDKIVDLIEDACHKGARLHTGGKLIPGADTLFEATVLDGMTAQMRIMHEEIFGPIAPIFTFDTEDEVIEMANATEYGLASYLYSENGSRAWRVAEALEYGMVGVNEALISTPEAPFGGVKQSGFGREGSKYGLDEYMIKKYLLMGVQAGS